MMRLVGALTLCVSSAYDFSNPKLTQCVIDGKQRGTPWLTRNNASYICTDEQWDTFYDPATAIAYTSMNAGDGPTHLACPVPSQRIKCFVFASWGQVAGGPDSCTDSCSTEAKAGAESCCGKACTDPGSFSAAGDDDAKCQNNVWHPEQEGNCGASQNGYCDCCPNCLECVHPKNESESLVPSGVRQACAEEASRPSRSLGE